MKNLRNRLIILECLSFLVSVLPLFVTIASKWNKYVHTAGDAVRLGLAGAMGLVFVIMKVLGKLKLPEHRVTIYALVFAFAYLLGNVLNDLILLSGMALLGEILDFLIFSQLIRKTREDIFSRKTAKSLAVELNNMQKNNLGRV